MLIVYEGEHEVLITTKEREQDTIKEWFTDGGRKIEDYNRDQTADPAIRVRYGAFVVD